MRSRFLFFTLVTIAMVGAAFQITRADEYREPPPCYDAVVVARPVRQIPSPIPDGDPNEIIMSWPWFIDLKIGRVIEGHVPNRELTALSVQHTYFRRKSFRMWLRRNSLGGFNLLRVSESDSVARCTDIEPAEPYIRLGNGETLDDVRRDGERRYGIR